MIGGWQPNGTENKFVAESDHDAQDYHSHNGQTVTPSDAEQIYKCLQVFISQAQPRGIEKEILESFIEWVARRDENDAIVDIPGFLIRQQFKHCLGLSWIIKAKKTRRYGVFEMQLNATTF